MSARCALIALAVVARGAPEPPCTAEARAYCRESRTSRAIERCLLAHADRGVVRWTNASVSANATNATTYTARAVAFRDCVFLKVTQMVQK